MSSADLIKLLLSNGFTEVKGGGKGSHRKFKKPNCKLIVVPHPRKDLPLGTASQIMKAAGLAVIKNKQ